MSMTADQTSDASAPQWRIGHGFDRHRLEPVAPAGAGRPLVLGGVGLESPIGPVGHSDGDAVLHALTDAVLGAIAEPDIGQLFPDTDPAWSGKASSAFVAEAVRRAAVRGYRVSNADVTVILERPKLGAHKAEIRDMIARSLGVRTGDVNIKGKTGESVGPTGEGRCVDVHAVVLLVRTAE